MGNLPVDKVGIFPHIYREMDSSKDIIRLIEGYCLEAGIAESYFGRLAVNDGKFMARLRSGGRAWPETVSKIEQFIQDNPPSQEPATEAAEG